jgi:hypothetical protein
MWSNQTTLYTRKNEIAKSMLTQEQMQGKMRQAIIKHCLGRFTTYMGHQVRKDLENRCKLIDDAIDLRFPDNESFISELAPPVVGKDYRETNAFLTKYFENDPITTFLPAGSTSKQVAENAQTTVHNNYAITKYRDECLPLLFDNLARYGTSVCFSQFNLNYNGCGLQTSYSGNGDTPYPRVRVLGKPAVQNYSIHPLNYFQDATANSCGRNSLKGFIDQWYVADLFRYIDNPLYIQDSLKRVIESCKKGQRDEFWYGNEHGGGEKSDIRDYTRATFNPLRFWTYLRFEGNENDETTYYVEIVNKELIRCHPNDHDYNLIPLEVGVYFPRPDTWYGNSNPETKMAFQNLKNWLINAKVEDVMKASDRIILTRRGNGVDVADIDNRHQYGGFVFTDSQEDLSRLMYPLNFQSSNQRDYDWLNREINQMIQESSASVNLSNKYNEGGMNNQTLGAAQMQAGMGEVMLGWPMRCVGGFLNRISDNNIKLLTQYLGDTVTMRKSAMHEVENIAKKDIIGEFSYENKSTVFINEKSDRMDKANVINQLINWMGSIAGDQFKDINLDPFKRDFIKSWVGQGADLNEYKRVVQQPVNIPQQGQQPQPPSIPQGQPMPTTGAQQ